MPALAAAAGDGQRLRVAGECGDSVVGRGRTIPFRWDGTLKDLPAEIDALGLRAIDDPEPPTALSALAAEVAADQQGRGLSGLIIESMTEVARRAGLAPLVAPVRPSRHSVSGTVWGPIGNRASGCFTTSDV